MGSYAVLKVGGKTVSQWKTEVDPTFLFVFTSDDLTIIPVGHEDNPYEEPLMYLRATARVLTDRLELLGVFGDDLDACLHRLIDEDLEETLELLSDLGGGYAARQEADTAWLKSMTMDSWIEQTKEAIEGPDLHWRDWPEWPLTRLTTMWNGMDTRWLLRAVLMCCDPADEIELDLTDLSLGGYIEDSNFDPQAAAAFMFSAAAANGTPAIIVTEGVTDTEFLRDALALRRPHLTRYVRFFDTNARAQGGAGTAVITLKAFAAAGVNNRVVMLLDNDTAAYEAMRGLDLTKLPSQYATGHLPHLESATAYPTVGATGTQPADVNGRAGAIELYLGVDVLTDPVTNELTPVEWGSRNRTLKRWQGELTDKGRVQRAFRDKVLAAQQDPGAMESQDWVGMDLVLEQLLALVRQCTVPFPGTVGGGLV